MNFNFLNFLIRSTSIFCLGAASAVKAQVVEDNTVPTQVTTEDNRNFTVNSGERVGNNLFHSFGKFSIPSNGSVRFNNASRIQNIISRVTGSSASSIDGLIQSNGSANLFLINPNGIIFGQNAALNVGGSFLATTAESLVFKDGSKFSAVNPNSQPILTVSVPLGIQFGNNPGSITNQSQSQTNNTNTGLSLLPGKTLALLGGNIAFNQGAVTAPIGNIELGSVGADSFVSLTPITKGWDISYENVAEFQDIKLDNLAFVSASGLGGGDISVQGQRIQILNGSAISSDTFGSIDGGTIAIDASESVEIARSDPSNQNIDPSFAGIGIFLPISSRITNNTSGEGKGGNIQITAKKLSLLNGGKIQAQTIANPDQPSQQVGTGGNITIETTASVELKGLKPLLGVADNVNELFPLAANDTIFAGLERFIAIGRSSSIGATSASNGSSGNISILTGQLKVQDGGVIANVPFVNGNAGDIDIRSKESVEISGSAEPDSSIVSLILANTFGQGDAGNVQLTTNQLVLKDGGGISTGTLSVGEGGNIFLNAQELEISGTSSDGKIRSGFGSETFGIGKAGNVTVNTELLTIKDQGQITVRGVSSGSAGNLEIKANSIELNERATITAATASEEGGNIRLQVRDNLTLQENSTISAGASNNASGGNIDINAKFVIVFPEQNNDILANAFQGNGGNINIKAQGIFGIEERNSQPANFTNDINASSKLGLSGTVAIAFPQVTVDQQLLDVSPEFVDANFLLQNSFCKVSRQSSYIVTGRGGIPLVPEKDFLAENTWSDWRIIEPGGDRADEEDKGVVRDGGVEEIQMIQGWVVDRQGKVVLTSNPLVVTPHAPETNTPSCP
jgi:filamentous hemagglutinin family protein